MIRFDGSVLFGKRFLKRLSAAVFFAGLLALLPACGYKIGARGMVHPQIHSIAISPVKNNTLEPLAADVMRMQIAGEFQRDGALKIKDIGKADCVLYAEITGVANQTIREDSYDYDVTYRPAEFRLTVTVEFTVLIPGGGTPLVQKRVVTGFSDYQILADPAVSRATALKFACYHAAQQVVEYTTEAW